MSEAIDAIGAADLRDLLGRLREALGEHREELDALNVFPVPDGDTGTNLLMTLRSALEAAEECEADRQVPRALARGATLGARGNSGVIFSQVVRAFADVVEEAGAIDREGLVEALARSRDRAYDAVARPVEGTILTAIAVAAETADDLAAADPPQLGHLTAGVRTSVSGAVQRTTDQLEALREAGVVDAGARGFELFCDVLDRFVRGERDLDEGEVPVRALERRDGPIAERESGSSDYRYEVQYLLDARADAAEDLREALTSIGDSVVVVDAGDVLSVHVHTSDIGAAIELALERGRPSRIEVTAFADAGCEQDDGPRAPADDPEGTDEGAHRAGAGAGGCVAGLPGPALRGLADQQGVPTYLATSGELPSVAEVLNTIGEAEGEAVIVLPGHPNVVPTARQAAEVSEAEGGRPIHVVDRATSPPRVLAALAVWDPAQSVDELVELMAEAATAVASGEVVAAVRDADTPAGGVRTGQWLAVHDGEVVAVEDDPVRALETLARACGCDSAEIVTLLVGDEVDDDERRRAEEVVGGLADGGELDVVDGGHRPVRYYLGAE